MRHALNGLQASHSGFGHVGRDQVFKVCDRPHPGIVRTIVDACINGGDTSTAVSGMKGLWDAGYAGTDIIGTLFRVVRNHGEMPEALKLEYLREIGFGHMRLADGADSLLQLLGLVSRLCQKVEVEDQWDEGWRKESIGWKWRYRNCGYQSLWDDSHSYWLFKLPYIIFFLKQVTVLMLNYFQIPIRVIYTLWSSCSGI